MISTDQIWQCEVCNRQFGPERAVLSAFVPCVPVLFVCGLPDCAQVKARAEEKERARVAARRARKQVRSAECGLRSAGKGAPGFAKRSVSGRMPYKDAIEDARWEEALPAAVGGGRGAEAAAVSPGLSEAEFQAQGKAASGNARFIEFFEGLLERTAAVEPLVTRWVARTELRDFCSDDYINNRADNCREHFWRTYGLWVDNGLVSPDGVSQKVSHYRLCRLAVAVSPPDAKGRERLGIPEPGQQVLTTD